jgi:hypothetical protein
MTIAEKAIKRIQAEILGIQIQIAEQRERGGEWAEATRLMKIAELRGDLAFCEANRDKPEEWWRN